MFGFFVPFWAPVIIKKQDDPLTSLRTTTDIQRASLKTLYQKKNKKKTIHLSELLFAQIILLKKILIVNGDCGGNFLILMDL